MSNLSLTERVIANKENCQQNIYLKSSHPNILTIKPLAIQTNQDTKASTNLDTKFNTNQDIKVNKQQSMCQKHSEKRGQYFQISSPWIKYCQSCALNLALCGKAIQKSLTPNQIYSKLSLTQTLSHLHTCLSTSSQSHNQYSSLISKTQSIRSYYTKILSSIQEYINKMIQVKGELEGQMDLCVNLELKSMFQRQSLLLSKKCQLENQVKRIQCDFVMLLKDQNQLNCQANIKNSQLLIQQCKQLFVSDHLKQNLISNFDKVSQQFNKKISFTNFTFKNINKDPIQIEKCLKSDKSRQKSKCKTSPFDVSDIRLNSQSSIIYPCTLLSSVNIQKMQLGSQYKKPLQQININRRSSRGCLQLRSRCNTKSNPKIVRQNIQINVRPHQSSKRIHPK